MTIGPDPMTRMVERSSRRPMSDPFRHELVELMEEVGAVVRPWTRLGVMLHAEGGSRAHPQPSHTPSLRFVWVTSARARSRPRRPRSCGSDW